MYYGINVATLGDYADPRRVVGLAVVAEAAGWDGLFVWDHLAFVFGIPSADPWITLAAVAARTDRLRIGTAVTPIPRWRPHLLAHHAAALDVLSDGRLVLGIGLGGAPAEFAAFGEPVELRERAALADEALPVVDSLLRGDAVSHAGPHYTVAGIRLLPRPIQLPRPPIWIGSQSKAGMRRAARWDGWFGNADDEHARMVKSPEAIAEEAAYVRRQGSGGPRVAVAIGGVSAPGERAMVAEYEAAADADWWIESIHGYRGTLGEMEARVAAGPPG